MTRSAPPNVVSQSATIAMRTREAYHSPVSLRHPRPIPPRFRRPVSPSLLRLVEQRHQRRRADMRQRWLRPLRRLEGRMRTLRWLLLPLGYAAIVLVTASIIVVLLFSPWTKVQEIRV